MKTILPLLRRGHAGQRRLHGQERAGQVDVERAPPVGKRGPVRRSAAGHAGIGDDDVERTARRFGLLVQRGHRGFVGDVGADARRCGCFRLATSASASSRRPQMVTSTPAPASASAIALPTPEPPPVTSACRPDDHTFRPIVALRSASR